MIWLIFLNFVCFPRAVVKSSRRSFLRSRTSVLDLKFVYKIVQRWRESRQLSLSIQTVSNDHYELGCSCESLFQGLWCLGKCLVGFVFLSTAQATALPG
jgi:hypothetical protein